MSRAIVSILIISALGSALVGCGGSGGTSAAIHSSGITHVTITWPQKKAFLIPDASNAVQLAVYDDAAGTTPTVGTYMQVVVRPGAGQPLTQTVNLVDIPMGDKYVFARAYASGTASSSTTNAGSVSGPALAVGHQPIHIEAGLPSSFSISMASTVDHYTMSVQSLPSGAATTFKAALGGSAPSNVNLEVGRTYGISADARDANESMVLVSPADVSVIASASLDVQTQTSQVVHAGTGDDALTTGVLRVKDPSVSGQIQVLYKDNDKLTRQFTFPVSVTAPNLSSPKLSWGAVATTNLAAPAGSTVDDFNVSSGGLSTLSAIGYDTTALGAAKSLLLVPSGATLAPVLPLLTATYDTNAYTARIGKSYIANTTLFGTPSATTFGFYSVSGPSLAHLADRTESMYDLVSGPDNADWVLQGLNGRMLDVVGLPDPVSYPIPSVTFGLPNSVALGSFFTNQTTLGKVAYLSTFAPNAGNIVGGDLTTGALKRVNLLANLTVAVDPNFDLSSFMRNATNVATDAAGWNGSDDLLYVLDASAKQIWVVSYYGHKLASIPLPADGSFYTRIKVENRNVYLLYVDNTGSTKIAVYNHQ